MVRHSSEGTEQALKTEMRSPIWGQTIVAQIKPTKSEPTGATLASNSLESPTRPEPAKQLENERQGNSVSKLTRASIADAIRASFRDMESLKKKRIHFALCRWSRPAKVLWWYELCWCRVLLVRNYTYNNVYVIYAKYKEMSGADYAIHTQSCR